MKLFIVKLVVSSWETFVSPAYAIPKLFPPVDIISSSGSNTRSVIQSLKSLGLIVKLVNLCSTFSGAESSGAPYLNVFFRICLFCVVCMYSVMCIVLREGRLPPSQTTAIVTPGLKKHGLDPADMKNYRPISNLSFMSKIVERVVVRQLSEYLSANGSLPTLQFGFRKHHSTESGLLRVLSDILSSVDKGQISLLALLDVSAAFYTVDHSILLDRLSISLGLTGSAFDWMRSFIIGRTQTVHYCGSVSRCAVVRSGVAQGSVLGPLLYTADIQRLVVSLGFGVHLYADDTQFHGSCKPADAADLAARAMDVINSVKTWMSSNRLRLNADKTQFIWLEHQPLPWKT